MDERIEDLVHLLKLWSEGGKLLDRNEGRQTDGKSRRETAQIDGRGQIPTDTNC